MIFHLAIYFSIISWLANIVFAQQNVTIDDADPSIGYAPAGSWVVSANSSLDFGGAHMLTQNPNATATFKFTGIAIYFLSPKWPYTVNTAVALDGGAPILIDLIDHSRANTGVGPETAQSSVVWCATGLNNTQHTLVISVGAGQPFGIVDGLTFTLAASTTASSTESQASSSSIIPIAAPPLESQTNSTSKKIHALPIVLGSLFGLLGVFIILLALFFAFKRRLRPTSEAWTVDGTQYSSPSSTSGMNYPPTITAASSHWDRGAAGYPMGQTAGGAWQNTRYGYVGTPAPPLRPPTDPSRAPNRYQPGFTLSTITEKSTPRIGEAHASLANTPASGVSSDLPSGYYTAPGSEAEGVASSMTNAARRPQFGVQSAAASTQGRLPEYSAQALQAGRPADRPLQAKAGWI